MRRGLRLLSGHRERRSAACCRGCDSVGDASVAVEFCVCAKTLSLECPTALGRLKLWTELNSCQAPVDRSCSRCHIVALKLNSVQSKGWPCTTGDDAVR